MHRHRTNSAVEGWNSRLTSIIGKQQPKVCLQVQKLKEAELVSWQPKSKENGERGQKRNKDLHKKRDLDICGRLR